MKRFIDNIWLHRVIILFLLVLIILLPTLMSKSTQTKLVKVYYGPAFVPIGTIFGITNIEYIVNSAYYYEAALLNYSTPVADTDYILPYGAQEAVKLPGLSNVHYSLIGGSYIQGSGSYLAFQAPNGGRFALLHLSRTFVGVPKVKVGQHKKFEDSTFLGARSLKHKKLGAGYYFGGEVVGYSGWPFWSEYANGGTPGPYDAHLCVVYDQLGADWFYHLLHLPPKPKPKPLAPFNYKLWHWYTWYHHKHGISPFYGHHHTSIADVWHHHMSHCRSVVSQWHYYRSKYPYTKQKFQHCTIFVWNNKNFKPKIT